MSRTRYLLAAFTALATLAIGLSPDALSAQPWKNKPLKSPPPTKTPSLRLKKPSHRLQSSYTGPAKATTALLAAPAKLRLAQARQRQSWRIRFDGRHTPRSIDAITTTPANGAAKTTRSAAALDFFAAHRDLFRLDDPGRELRLRDQTDDVTGATHLHFTQLHQGLPLWGADLTLHLSPDQTPYAFNGVYYPSPAVPLPSTPSLSAAQAQATAADYLNRHPSRSQPQPLTQGTLPGWIEAMLPADTAPQLCYWSAGPEQPLHLAWHIETRPDWRQRWRLFVDATDGTVLEAYNNAPSEGPADAAAVGLDGVARTINTYESDGLFYMIDTSRPIFATAQTDVVNAPRGAIVTLDARASDLDRSTRLFHVTAPDNIWSDPIAVAAHTNTGRVFDYFFRTHGRRGLDGRGGNMIALVHVTEGGRPMENAFWNGVFMAYGDGGRSLAPLAGALDVAGHEMTHGVIENTVNLEYRFQSGALNESLADVFAAMVDRDDWLIGEDVVNPAVFTSGALRDMENPNNGGRRGDRSWQPAHMDEFVELDLEIDNGGVHINSGIPNRACALLAGVIGRDKTERIYYRTLEARYLNSRSNFADMRLAASRAAADLFGTDSPEVEAVHTAFTAVGIGTEAPSEAPADLAAVEGEQWVAVVNADLGDNSLYLARPQIDADADIVQLTSTQIRTRTGNPISVTEDGSVLIFIDADNFIRAISSDGSDEEVLSEEGVWSSIALSPDGRRLAATTVFQDSTLLILDLENPELSQEIHLYNPTTQDGVRAFVTVFADAMAWDLSGRFLVYDAFNSVPQADGPAIEFWNVNVLDVNSGIILPLFPAQPEGINIGNPTLGRTNDSFLAFDLVDFNSGTSEIWTVNLFSGDANFIESTGEFAGYPHFAPDDGSLIFEYRQDGEYSVRQVALNAERNRPLTPSIPYLSAAQRPVWFAIGQRPAPTAINTEPANTAGPQLFSLAQNHPNPFNSQTQIRYQVPAAGSMRLEIFDLLGRRVVLLQDGPAEVGLHTLTWNGRDTAGRPAASGVYLYRLETGDASLTRKLLLLR
jgi:bacillolysin